MIAINLEISCFCKSVLKAVKQHISMCILHNYSYLLIFTTFCLSYVIIMSPLMILVGKSVAAFNPSEVSAVSRRYRVQRLGQER